MADPPGLLEPPPIPQPQAPQSPGFLGGLLSGGGYSPAAMYGGQLTDQATIDAFRNRSLAAMANAFGQGAMPVPYRGGVPFGATIGAAANAAATANDPTIAARTQAAQGQLYGVQAETQRALIQARMASMGMQAQAAAMDRAGAGGAAAGPPGTTPAPKLLDKAKGEIVDFGDPQLNLIAYHESGYRPNVGTGDHDLSGYQLNQNGFPMWEGIPTKYGRSTAAGYFQITRTNWDKFAPPLIASGQMQPDFSAASQVAVAKAMKAVNPGLSDWLPFNGPLREAYARGDVIKVPGGPGSTEAAIAPAPAGATGAPEIAGTAAAALGRRPLGANAPLPVPAAAPGPGALPQVPDFAGRLGPPGGLLNQPPAAAPPGPQVGAGRVIGAGGGAPAPLPPQAGGDVAPPGLLTGGSLANTMAQQRAVAPLPPAAPALPSQNIPPPPVGLPPNVPRVGQPAPPGGPPGLMTQPGAPEVAPPPSGAPGGAAAPFARIPTPTPAAIPGAPSPERIALAKQIVQYNSTWGLPVPESEQKIASYPITVATAQATAQAQENVKFPYGVATKQLEPANIRGGGGLYYNPLDQTFTGTRTRVAPDGTMHNYAGRWTVGGQTISETDMGQASLSPGQTKAQEIGAELGRGVGIPGEPIRAGVLPPEQGGVDPGKPMPSPDNASRGYQTKIPAITQQARTPDLKTYSASQSEWIKESGELADAGLAAQRAETNLNMLRDAFKTIQTGTWAEQSAEVQGMWQALAQRLGIKPPQSVADLAAVQTAMHANYKQTLNQLAAVNKKFTGGEFQINSKAGEDVGSQPEANLNLLSADIGQVRQLQSLSQDWNHAQTMVGTDGSRWVNPDSFKLAWMRENPLEEFVQGAREELAGTIKGLPGAPPPTSGGGRQLRWDPQLGRAVPQ
jgi:hypothetical protein